MQNHTNNKKSGFTLVELAIVLVIVGLLIGGVLIAQSITDSARVNRLVSDLRQYEVATNLFKQNFGNYPGDSPHFTPPGAPDDILGRGDTDGDGEVNAVNCNGIYSNYESYQFWAHLSQSEMLKENFPSFQPDSCGGSHTQAEQQKGLYTPYIEFSSDTAVTYTGLDTYAINPYKLNSTDYLRFYIPVDPLDTLALEKKMGGQSYDATKKQIGLINVNSLGNCYAGPCTASNPGQGELYYYIAPID